jgi:hypothetical protein
VQSVENLALEQVKDLEREVVGGGDEIVAGRMKRN